MNRIRYIKRAARVALSCFVFSTLSQAYSTDYLDEVLKAHLSSFPLQVSGEIVQEEIINPDNIKDITQLFNFVKTLFKPSPFKIIPISEHEQRERIARNIASLCCDEKVIDDKADFIHRMEILNGPQDHAGDHVFARLTSEHQLSKLGEKRLREMLAQPITSAPELTRRSSIIKALVESPELLAQLDEQVRNFREKEHLLLGLLQKADVTQSDLIARTKWNKFFTKWLNHDSRTIEAGVRLDNAGTALGVGSAPLGFLWGYFKYLRHIPDPVAFRFVMAISLGYTGFWWLVTAPTALANAKLNNSVMQFLQEYLIGLSSCMSSMETIYSTAVGGHPTFEKYKASLEPLARLLQPSSNHSRNFNELVDLLKNETFQGEPSFFSYMGRVLYVYQLTRDEQARAELGESLNTFGELEAYIALAKKMVALQKTGAPTCFVKFVENQPVPVISTKKFWNIFVAPEKAVSNSIELGNNAVHGLILSGPNTGGKSTTMKALLLNQFFAQTFGIAFAEQYGCTLFANLNCYLNVTDHTGSGVSGLKAEVLRAKELVQSVKSLGFGEFAFIILDEIFTATSPDQAAKLAKRFIKSLAESNKAIFIDATHFKEITEIENDECHCKNYHMGVVLDQDGRVKEYTYKLAEGPSDVHNAEQVADQEHVFDFDI